MAINRISGNILQDDLRRGTDLSIQGNLIYFDVTNDRVGIRTSTPSDDLDIDGVLRVGNVTISSIGNIDAGGVNINDLAEPQSNTDAATKFYVDAQSSNLVSLLGDFVFSNTTISTDLGNSTIAIVPTGNGVVSIATDTGLVLPLGNTLTRPSPPVTGTVRFNTDTQRLELYDGAEWDSVVAGVTAQIITPDGSSTQYLLDRSSTSAATLVSINGVVQLPVVSYIVTGNIIDFAEAPQTTDIIDLRFL